MPKIDPAGEVGGVGNDADEAVCLARVVRGAEFQRHLVLGAKLDCLLVLSGTQVPDVELVSVLTAQQQFRHDAVFDHLGGAPLAGDHRVVVDVPPEVVGEILRPPFGFPRALDLERLMVYDEDAAGPVAFGVSERVHVDAVRSAVHGVGTAVTRLLLEVGGFDYLGELRRARVFLGVHKEDVGRAQPAQHQVAALYVRVRHVGAERCRAGVPAEVMQLVARIGQV